MGWRYPHLMFRNDSKKNKAVSFRNHQGRNQLEVPGIGFGEFAKHLRRTDSKDSSCSSLSSQHELRPSLSVPTFHDHFNKFKRTDSESSGSSFASIGLSILSRGGSRKAGRNTVVEGVDRAIERADSSQSFSSQCRKDSITNAVRRNSGGENTRPENIW